MSLGAGACQLRERRRGSDAHERMLSPSRFVGTEKCLLAVGAKLTLRRHEGRTESVGANLSTGAGSCDAGAAERRLSPHRTVTGRAVGCLAERSDMMRSRHARPPERPTRRWQVHDHVCPGGHPTPRARHRHRRAPDTARSVADGGVVEGRRPRDGVRDGISAPRARAGRSAAATRRPSRSDRAPRRGRREAQCPLRRSDPDRLDRRTCRSDRAAGITPERGIRETCSHPRNRGHRSSTTPMSSMGSRKHGLARCALTSQASRARTRSTL